MSFWKNLAQLAVRRFDPAECVECPKGQPGADPAFATAVTALGAKLAMADGLAQDVEQTAFLQVFKPEDAARRDVLRLYELARQTPHGFESYAKRLAKRYSSCPQILEDVLEGLFHIAVADGYLTHEEETYLETVSRLFGLKSTTYRSIRSGYVPADTEDPYVILGIEPHASDEEVRKARRLRLSDVHPDRIRARGLPPDFETLYTQKAARINLAFDGIMKERMADSTTM
ncbi:MULTISPECIES: molecular chaperone DjiA [Asticcacaulis]|uniref:molecular chaperone DjiA n=1 Tax=Asticcacaulis TaxID=76890 RepID=UPI001AE42949|nr:MULTISPECIES: molecular chaperone DjiA [Asticcacaulis]MBP2157645.1 DnaJ like chaperone protein [Asticcacaulis solisilvae]MDR6798690.1 DnaJ like chaperone protein [Asticcacaulis sp. BE141]